MGSYPEVEESFFLSKFQKETIFFLIVASKAALNRENLFLIKFYLCLKIQNPLCAKKCEFLPTTW